MTTQTRIEWVKNPDGTAGYTVNPVKGLCPMACGYCYARRMYQRFKWNPEIRYDPAWWRDIAVLRQPSRIFVGSTMELFGPWVEDCWMNSILEYCRRLHQHTFIFLTKKPENLRDWSPFPGNVHVGVSVTNQQQFDDAVKYLKEVQATVKFLSFEPLLERIDGDTQAT